MVMGWNVLISSIDKKTLKRQIIIVAFIMELEVNFTHFHTEQLSKTEIPLPRTQNDTMWWKLLMTGSQPAETSSHLHSF